MIFSRRAAHNPAKCLLRISPVSGNKTMVRFAAQREVALPSPCPALPAAAADAEAQMQPELSRARVLNVNEMGRQGRG